MVLTKFSSSDLWFEPVPQRIYNCMVEYTSLMYLQRQLLNKKVLEASYSLLKLTYTKLSCCSETNLFLIYVLTQLYLGEVGVELNQVLKCYMPQISRPVKLEFFSSLAQFTTFKVMNRKRLEGGKLKIGNLVDNFNFVNAYVDTKLGLPRDFRVPGYIGMVAYAIFDLLDHHMKTEVKFEEDEDEGFEFSYDKKEWMDKSLFLLSKSLELELQYKEKVISTNYYFEFWSRLMWRKGELELIDRSHRIKSEGKAEQAVGKYFPTSWLQLFTLQEFLINRLEKLDKRNILVKLEPTLEKTRRKRMRNPKEVDRFSLQKTYNFRSNKARQARVADKKPNLIVDSNLKFKTHFRKKYSRIELYDQKENFERINNFCLQEVYLTSLAQAVDRVNQLGREHFACTVTDPQLKHSDLFFRKVAQPSKVQVPQYGGDELFIKSLQRLARVDMAMDYEKGFVPLLNYYLELAKDANLDSKLRCRYCLAGLQLVVERIELEFESYKWELWYLLTQFLALFHVSFLELLNLDLRTLKLEVTQVYSQFQELFRYRYTYWRSDYFEEVTYQQIPENLMVGYHRVALDEAYRSQLFTFKSLAAHLLYFPQLNSCLKFQQLGFDIELGSPVLPNICRFKMNKIYKFLNLNELLLWNLCKVLGLK